MLFNPDFFFHQKCMETKNTILARQKEMQLSLDKVKHLIRLIQAFNFSQALAETEGKDVRVQDGAEAPVGSDAAPDLNSVDTGKPGSSSSSSTDNKEEEHGAAGSDQTAAGDAGGQTDSTVLTADTSPGSGAGGGGSSETGLQAEAEAEPETEAAPVADVAATVATTNGTSEPPCPDRGPDHAPDHDHGPTGGCTTNATTNSENKMAVVNPPETAAEKKQEEITDSDGSNTNNSKTSEPSQHSLPALVSSLDNNK